MATVRASEGGAEPQEPQRRGRVVQIFFRGQGRTAREGEVVENIRRHFRIKDPEVDLIFEDPSGYDRIISGEWAFEEGQRFRSAQPLNPHGEGEGWMEMPKWQ